MCEAMFEAEDGMTEAFRRFNDMAIVCVTCYLEKKQVHMSLPSGGRNAV